MMLRKNTLFRPRQITNSHINGYLNDRLNAQRVLAVISLLIPLTLFSLYLIAPHASDSGSAFLLISISLIVITTAIVRLLANWKKPRKDIYQLTSAFLDFLGIAAILVGYAFTYDVPISVALKSPTANVFFVFLTSRVMLLNGPILLKTCGAAVAIWVALVGLALFEPEFTGRTSSYVEYLTSFKVLIGAEVERVLQFNIVTAILYTFINLIRHDPATGYFRRPIFLQSIDKFLGDSKHRKTENTHALIELRIASLAHTGKICDAVFSLAANLPLLKTVKVIKIGRLSNRNMALWICFERNHINLGNFAHKLSIDINHAAVSNLGSQVPAVLIGGTLFDYDCSSEEHFAFTDIAIREARTMGQSARIFDETLRASIARKDCVKQAIQDGLDNNLFSVHYQPIMDLMTDKPIGFEALIRLKDMNGTMISPSVFVPVAEATGLISDVADHLCTIVGHEASLICDIFLNESIEPYININISPQQLNDIERTLAALKRARAGRVTINIEITESSILNEGHALEQIEKLKAAKFSLAIDDFGTGYSSIHRLDQLNVSTLKIDQCFIKNIEDDKGYRFLKSIVDLSRTTSDFVIIEGVETLAQKLLLMKMGVRFCQGYLFAKPMKLEQLEDHLSNRYGLKRTSQNRAGHISVF